jgi:NTP pyrophosphatase (non-canonical NTP hydrolase)
VIRVFGIGPQLPPDNILGGLERERTLVARSRFGLPPPLAQALTHSYDSVLDRLDPSEALETVVAELVSRGAEEDVVYLVPGSGTIGDLTVAALTARAEVTLYPGRLATPTAASHLQVIDALALALAEESAPFDGGHVALDPTTPALVTNWRGTKIVELATKRLERSYGRDNLPVANPQGEMLLPGVDPVELGRSVSALARIVAALRAPDGCPWDREQTPQSLAPQLVEEARELAEALRSQGVVEQIDEMGDVLLHIVLLAQMGREAGTFAFEDVVAAVSAKMVRRHPHVFAGLEVATVDEVLANWQRIKAEERAEAGR